MSPIRFQPASRTRDLASFQNEVDRLFDGVLARSAPARTAWAPAVDIEETADAFHFRADLPGIAPQDLKLSIEADTLTLSGERKPVVAATEGSVQRSERVHGAFLRKFTFNSPVRADAITAQYRDGVLEVSVPKSDVAKARAITVKVG